MILIKFFNFFINKNIDVKIDQDIISWDTFDWSNINELRDSF